jgi:3-hydroxybutyryl-CoA dehydrogenase
MTIEPVREVGVAGAGFMGSGIAEAAARAGVRVTVYEPG